ncbi:hypothetical protein SEA_FLAGSTAFF_30 [Mycobacterium phage FlagStaff]|uniref:Uncharacterized protein n=1 Tax=Mycobacterium phage FlagStaff TaxID=1647304 RepID=A0A0F6SJM3_9CAUD|nr:hypothetical protein AVT49_gp30 [Mycobacterium phage FlagStaff]AKF14467.1 hypothetical protein SEA_FLAGSTAFF_30 [Mycobacterium phage FlagStaff]
MADVFTNLLSWSLVVGIVIGFALSKLWQLARVCYAEKHNPLPDGRRRSKWRAMATDRRWLIGMIAVAFLGWSVFTTSENATNNERNAREAAAFAARVQDCQSQLIAAINQSRQVTADNEKLSADNDRLSQEERGLLADGQRALVEWVGKLVDPPDPRVKGRDTDDPVRQQYGVDVSRAFFAQVGDINKRIEAIHAEQRANDAARPAARAPLPDPDCGS